MILIELLYRQIVPSYSPADHIRLGWWLLTLPILLGVLLYGFATILGNWRAPKRAVIRVLLLIVATVVSADVASYVEEAYLRVTVKPSRCKVDRPPGSPYEVMVCVTVGSAYDGEAEGFVRLRSTVDGSVLAEELFNNPSFDIVSWEPDNLHVGIADGSADIRLPPTRWDWFRAKLP